MSDSVKKAADRAMELVRSGKKWDWSIRKASREKGVSTDKIKDELDWRRRHFSGLKKNKPSTSKEEKPVDPPKPTQGAFDFMDESRMSMRRILFEAEGPDIATCGTCGLSWDDSIVTGMTPAPAARCPFEYFHEKDDEGEDIELEPDEIPEDFPVVPIGRETRSSEPDWQQKHLDNARRKRRHRSKPEDHLGRDQSSFDFMDESRMSMRRILSEETGSEGTGGSGGTSGTGGATNGVTGDGGASNGDSGEGSDNTPDSQPMKSIHLGYTHNANQRGVRDPRRCKNGRRKDGSCRED